METNFDNFVILVEKYETKEKFLKVAFPDYKLIKVEKPKRGKKLLPATFEVSNMTIKYWVDHDKDIVYYI